MRQKVMCIDAGGIYGSRVLGGCGNGDAAGTSSVSGEQRVRAAEHPVMW